MSKSQRLMNEDEDEENFEETSNEVNDVILSTAL